MKIVWKLGSGEVAQNMSFVIVIIVSFHHFKNVDLI